MNLACWVSCKQVFIFLTFNLSPLNPLNYLLSVNPAPRCEPQMPLQFWKFPRMSTSVNCGAIHFKFRKRHELGYFAWRVRWMQQVVDNRDTWHYRMAYRCCQYTEAVVHIRNTKKVMQAWTDVRIVHDRGLQGPGFVWGLALIMWHL